MAVIGAEPSIGRLGRRACVRGIHAGASGAVQNGRLGGVAGPGGSKPEMTLASRGARQRVAPCDRPREGREWARLLPAGLFACVAVVLVGLFGLPASGSPAPARTVVVQVAAGDTLWSLAQRFAPHDDPRAIVRRIVELNALDGAKLQIGQPLAVPADAG